MPIKFLYIDDEEDQIVRGAINALQSEQDIFITFKGLSSWEQLIDDLVNLIPEFDGLILDLRLNDNPYAEGKSAQYKGSTVAQELRSLSKEKSLKDLPIILFSGTDKIEHYLDPTSNDLFDSIIDKNKIEQPNQFTYKDFRTKLKWLSNGYDYINKSDKNVNAILKLIDLSSIDIRFIETFQDLMDKPVHTIARFLIKQVIIKPTFLINEDYLSVRLGINKASGDWSLFIEKCLTDFKYNGAFSDFYPRWWMYLIEDFWIKKISSEYSIRNTDSSKKVELIKEKTGFKDLQPIEKQDKSKSRSFWVVCKATHVAIDTIDGFVITGQDAKYPWQEPEYISINEALRPTLNFEVSAIEKPRLQKLKQVFEKYEKRDRK